MSADEPKHHVSQSPNPEQRSDAALLLFLMGGGLMGLAWLLGLGGVIALALSGGADGMMAGGIASLIILPLTAVVGLLLLLSGAIWMIVRAIADSREARSGERYRDVQR